MKSVYDGAIRVQVRATRLTRREQGLWLVGSLLAAALVAGLTGALCALPFITDDLDMLGALALLRAGDVSWWHYLALHHNEHRVPLLRLLYWGATLGGDFDAVPIRVSILAVHAGCAALGGAAVDGDRPIHHRNRCGRNDGRRRCLRRDAAVGAVHGRVFAFVRPLSSRLRTASERRIRSSRERDRCLGGRKPEPQCRGAHNPAGHRELLVAIERHQSEADGLGGSLAWVWALAFCGGRALLTDKVLQPLLANGDRQSETAGFSSYRRRIAGSAYGRPDPQAPSRRGP